MSFINKYLRNFEPYKTASHKVWTVPADERKGDGHRDGDRRDPDGSGYPAGDRSG